MTATNKHFPSFHLAWSATAAATDVIHSKFWLYPIFRTELEDVASQDIRMIGIFYSFCLSDLFSQHELRMRNKTLLIRRHLIHYWHLSNQTTFHKTLFSHSDDEDWKIEHGKYAPCYGKETGSVLSPRTASLACDTGQNTFQREPLSTMLWLGWKAPQENVPKLFRKFFAFHVFHESGELRRMAQDMDEVVCWEIKREKREL